MRHYIFTLFLTLFLGSSLQALEMKECNYCTKLQMNNLARNTINNGEVIVYNPSARVANKYQVKTERAEGLPLKIATTTDMSTGEKETIELLYHLYSEFGATYKSFVTELELTDYPNGLELANLTAYDVMTTSAYRNDISTFINSNISNIGSRIDGFNAIFTAIAKAIENLLSDVLSMTIIVKFSDGSQLAYELSIANGNMAMLNRESLLNRDAEGQDLITANSSDYAGIYRFSNLTSYNSFRNAASLWGIAITGDTDFVDDDEITVTCYWRNSSVLTCVATKNQ